MYNKQVHNYRGINKGKDCLRVKHNENGDFALVCPMCGNIIRFTGKISINLNTPKDVEIRKLTQILFCSCTKCGAPMNMVDPNIAKAVTILNNKGYYVSNSSSKDGDKEMPTIITIRGLKTNITIPDNWYIKPTYFECEYVRLMSSDPDYKNRIATLNKFVTELKPLKYKDK